MADDPTQHERNTTMTKTWDELRGEDIIDSLDIIERLNELQEQEERDEDEAAELAILVELNEDGEQSAPDWTYGEGMIRDDYFEQYAEQLAEDIGAIDSQAAWPLSYIDWTAAAAALQQDYTSIEVDGLTYWVR